MTPETRLEPSWNIVDPDPVLAGSMQAQDEEQASGSKAVTGTIDQLVGRNVERLAVEPVTGDLAIGLNGGVRVRTFASDPRETFHRRITDHAMKESLVGSPQRMQVESLLTLRCTPPGA
jgi:hypothetical protein